LIVRAAPGRVCTLTSSLIACVKVRLSCVGLGVGVGIGGAGVGLTTFTVGPGIGVAVGVAVGCEVGVAVGAGIGVAVGARVGVSVGKDDDDGAVVACTMAVGVGVVDAVGALKAWLAQLHSRAMRMRAPRMMPHPRTRLPFCFGEGP
jgi:hypothetical protein